MLVALGQEKYRYTRERAKQKVDRRLQEYIDKLVAAVVIFLIMLVLGMRGPVGLTAPLAEDLTRARRSQGECFSVADVGTLTGRTIQERLGTASEHGLSYGLRPPSRLGLKGGQCACPLRSPRYRCFSCLRVWP